MATTLILPGISNSGPEHWQTRWEKVNPSFMRVQQDEWEAPRCADWVKRLDETISSTPPPIVLVGHSSACALVAHWVQQASPANLRRIQGALLVGPSDPDGPNYPPEPTGFSPMPLAPLPFRTIVVASTDDKFVTLERAMEYATAWRARLVVVQKAGHINSASGLGDWPEGFALLNELQKL